MSVRRITDGQDERNCLSIKDLQQVNISDEYDSPLTTQQGWELVLVTGGISVVESAVCRCTTGLLLQGKYCAERGDASGKVYVSLHYDPFWEFELVFSSVKSESRGWEIKCYIFLFSNSTYIYTRMHLLNITNNVCYQRATIFSFVSKILF